MAAITVDDIKQALVRLKAAVSVLLNGTVATQADLDTIKASVDEIAALVTPPTPAP